MERGMEQPTPTFGRLFTHDTNFRLAVFLALAPVVSFVYSQIKSGDLFSFELNLQTLFLPGVSVLGIIWLLYQYNTIMTTFREGITIKGTVIRTEEKSSPRQKGRRAYTYHTVISYSINNESYEKRIKLPAPPEKHGLTKGTTVDLIIREEKPRTVFIKMLYLP